MEKLLQIIGIEIKHSVKCACEFKVVRFKGVKFLGSREVKTNLEGIRTFWPSHEMEVGGVKTTIKGDTEFNTLLNGDLLEGEIKTFTTSPYLLNGREVTSWRGVVFPHEDGMAVCARSLREYHAAPIDEETGEVYRLPSTTQGLSKVLNGIEETPAGLRVVHGELIA